MSFDAIPDLLADLIAEQRNTTAAVVALTEAIAALGDKPKRAKAATEKAIERAMAVPALEVGPPVEIAVTPIHAAELPPPPSAPTAAPATLLAPAKATPIDRGGMPAKLVGYAARLSGGRDAVTAAIKARGANHWTKLDDDDLVDLLADLEAQAVREVA